MPDTITPWPERLGFTPTVFNLPTLRVHAAVAGPADGPLVVLLHGFPETSYSWRHQMGPLAQAGFRVVAPDQRGYALTDKHGPYDLDTLVGDVVHLIQACGQTSAHVAGHDWGAAVAWHLVDTHPERVRRLAILNVPHPQVMQRAILRGNWRQALKSWYILFFQLPWLPERLLSLNNYHALRRAFQTSSLPHTFTSQDIDVYVEAAGQPGALSAMLGWYRVFIQRAALRSGDTRPPRRIQVPTLILWGDQDIALEKSLADESLKLLDHGRLLHFPNATHWVHEDSPTEVAFLLAQHFRR